MQAEPDVIPDDALVVRGGKNRAEDVDKGIGLHPSGVAGVSVHAAIDILVGELAVGIPHGQIGITTVADVRNAGGDVVRTSGRSPHHATLTGLSPEEISRLLTPTQPNSVRSETKAENTDG